MGELHNNILPISEKNEDNLRIRIMCRGCFVKYRPLAWKNFTESNSAAEGERYDNSYIILQEEPENPYDLNAIAVMCRGEVYGLLGYVGREYTDEVREVLKMCRKYRLDMADEKQAGEGEVELILQWINK